MSRLREMIEELCPDGVEYRKLGEILSRHKGIAITAGRMKELHTPDGEIRIFAAGNTYADVMESDVDRGGIIREPAIIVKSRGNIGFEYYTKPFSHKNEMWSYTTNHAFISLKYVYYVLEQNIAYFQNKAKTGKLPQISISDTENYEIPVPPLPIQNEIVKLLDNFTELTAELALRKKQYNFYRDSLLNFDQNDRDVEWKTIGMIGDVTKLAGFEFTKYVTYVETGKIIALRGLNVKGKLDLTDVKYLDGSDLTKLERSKLYKDDILFTYVGTVGQVALVDCDDKYYLAPNVARIRLDKEVVDPAYIRYFFQTEYFMRKQIEKYAKTSSMKNLTMENIRKFQVPIPPLEVQAKIVSILDRFDTLCNDLSLGIPAEIAARRKQYEYYRDKLLTFHRKGA